MGDLLRVLANKPVTSQLTRALGLPQPRVLARERGPYRSRPLEGRVVVAEGSPGIARAVAGLGASSREGKVQVAAFDARGLRTPEALGELYSFFHPLVPKLAPSARVVLVAADERVDPVAAATARAVEGFTRALAKELGRRGATANLLYAPEGADLEGPLRFFATDRSAFVSGQAVRLTASTARGAEERPLAGKVALVTGAARGLGAATARRLSEEGARVVGVDVKGAEVELDITTEGAPGRIADALAGGVDVVVHNAGITRDRSLGKMARAEWDAVLGVNLGAIVRIDRELAARQLLRDDARVVCISSVSGIAGIAGQTNYSASKAALLGYVAAQAAALAHRGVTVNAIAPGFIETEMTAKMPMMLREAARRLSSLSQGGEPSDVAEAVTFLASPYAAGINGQSLRVCGQALIGA